jgi:superfamily II DNA or RNA helicase/ribosome-binding factor A
MKPFPYQQYCLNALGSARKRGRTKALVVMATGLGKTVVSAFEIQRLLKTAPGRVLYLCHNNHILKQARATYEEILGDSYTYGYFHGTEKHLHHVDVLFASFQTMATWREAFLRNEFRYIVVDEVHHAHASTFRPTVEYFEPEWMVGFTATPERGDGLDITTLFEGKPVYNLGLFKALARRYLCDVDYRLMTDEIQNTGILDTPAGKLSIAELNRTIFIPKRDEEIARIIDEKVQEIENPRVMIFCASIEHAERMAALMPHAAVVHSKLKAAEKDRRLEAFRRGDVDTILTVDMLNEGIDVPEANVVVFLRSTASRTVFLQQLGRGLRKALGKLKVLVLDFVANCERIEMIDQLQQAVRNALSSSPSGSTADGDEQGGRPAFTLTLDGIEFDERKLKLFEVISTIRSAARQSYVAHNTYTREVLAEQLLAKAKNGVMPSIPQVDADPDMASSDTFERIFGKPWNDIAAELGLRPNKRKGYTKAELTAQLLAKARDGKMPLTTEVEADPDMASCNTFVSIFGKSWEGIAAELGLRPNLRKDYTKAELTAQLLAKARGGEMPTKTEVDDDPDMASAGTFLKVFGKPWNDIAAELGLRAAMSSGYTKAELTDQLLAKARRGKMPTTTEVDADADMAGTTTFVNIFGKPWNGIAAEVGLRPSRQKGKTKAELTAQLLAKTKDGKMPTKAGVDADPDMASASTFLKVFGKPWNDIAAELGLAPTKP